MNNNFESWIASIEKDSTLIIDTSILRQSKDSFYFYLRFDDKDFISPIPDAKHRMVIVANNQTKWAPKTRIYLLATMEYYFEPTNKNKIRAKTIYQQICKEIKGHFEKNIEHKSHRKNKAYGTNSFYLKGNAFPSITVKWWKYKDKNYWLILLAHYELNPTEDNL